MRIFWDCDKVEVTKMSANAAIALPESLAEKVAQRASTAGLSAEQWVEVALCERIRMEEETSAFFDARAVRASGRSLKDILKNVGNNLPDRGDEI